MSEPSSQPERQDFDQGDWERAKIVAEQWTRKGDVTIIRHTPSRTSSPEQGAEDTILAHGSVEETGVSQSSKRAGTGQSSFPSSSESTHPSSEESEEPAMTREELKAHLEANEARIEQMTDRVEQKLDNFSSQVDTKISAVDDKIGATRNWVIGIGTAILIVMVSLFVYALNQTDRLEDRVFENTQRIEQVAPQTEGSTSQSDKDSGQEQ